MSELVTVRAADEAALAAELGRLVGFLDRVPDVGLLDVAYTCCLTKGPSVVAVVTDSTADLRTRLASVRSRLETGGVRRVRDKSGTYYFRDHLLGADGGKLAFVYPGVMSFYPDMMRDLVIAHPECRRAFDELEEALAKEGGAFTPSAFVFPPAPYYRHDADIFSSGAYAQALVSTCAGCNAMTRLLTDFGVTPAGVVGFAGGDLAALMRAGVIGDALPRPERVNALREIYRIVGTAVDHAGLPKAAMISVLLRHPGEADAVIAAMPADKVALSLAFSPRQKTYAVAPDYEAEFLRLVGAAGIRAMKLALDRPFNTPQCASLVPAFAKLARGWVKRDPACDLYTCASAGRVEKMRAVRADAAERWAKPVRFEETVRAMYADGYRVFLEVGPRGLLTSAVGDTLKGTEHAALAMDSIHRRGTLQVQHALAQLVALGQEVDFSAAKAQRGARRLDFDSAIALQVRKDVEMRLSRVLPKMTLLSDGGLLKGTSALAEIKGRGMKAAARAAAVAAQARRQRQFDFGALNPLVSDADVLASSPGVSVEITKTFRLSDLPFVGDCALGTSQLSYSDPNLRGLVLLTLPVGAEIMAEVAQMVMPNRCLTAIEDLVSRRTVSFSAAGELKLFVRAERVAAGAANRAAVKVQIRDDAPNAAYTWPVMEATVVLGETPPALVPAKVDPLTKPRNVHWSGRDVYPTRLCHGRRQRGIRFVEAWSESGLDYEVVVPPRTGNVVFTRFPMWALNPILLETVASGFALWRSHERFVGAFSFPFRLRRLEIRGVEPKEGAQLKCYLRLTGVTPKSHISDITVTDGNGQVLMELGGWEELTERVPAEYRELIMQPATAFLTKPIAADILGDPATDVASAFVTDVPYPIFERNEELWLKTLSRVVLGEQERKEFDTMTGSVSRRTEWLFGRVAAKEAVRRFLKDFYQARWSDADVMIFADEHGKPRAIGEWGDYLTARIDIAIAHTSQFVVAVAAASARVGVDVESVARDLSEEFTAGVFTPEELELAAQAANAAQAVIRFWCAKEAVSKALGTGIRYSPREMTVTGYQADTGGITMRLEGAWVEAFKAFKGRDIPVASHVVHDHALATCFIPASLFADES